MPQWLINCICNVIGILMVAGTIHLIFRAFGVA